jgi:hypothetical protein
MKDRTMAINIRTVVAVVLGISVSMGFLATSAIAKPAPVTKIKFKLDDHNVPPGSAVTSSVLVRTRSGHNWVPFVGAPISVRVGGAQVLSLTTDANGIVAISYVAAAGDHVMKVVFAGDATHKRAQRAQGFSVVVGATAAPNAPVLTATAGTATVHLSWTVPPDGGSTITSYHVFRGVSSGTESLLATVTSGTIYDDFTVTSPTTYYYEVSAVNAEGEGARSTEVAATPL